MQSPVSSIVRTPGSKYAMRVNILAIASYERYESRGYSGSGCGLQTTGAEASLLLLNSEDREPGCLCGQ